MPLGNLLIFLAILGNSYYNVGIKKIADRYTEMEMVFYTYVIMVIFLTPLVLYYEPDVFARIPSFTQQTWIGMSLLTFFHNFLSMILFFKALKVLDAIQVALSNYLITFIGLPVAAIWLGEKLNTPAIVGGILVFVSTLIITIVDYRITHRVAIEPMIKPLSKSIPHDMKSKKELLGIVPIIPTPFTDKEEIDEDALKGLIDFAISGGVQAACLPAYASEFYKLTDEEKLQVVKIAVDHSAGTNTGYCSIQS